MSDNPYAPPTVNVGNITSMDSTVEQQTLGDMKKVTVDIGLSDIIAAQTHLNWTTPYLWIVAAIPAAIWVQQYQARLSVIGIIFWLAVGTLVCNAISPVLAAVALSIDPGWRRGRFGKHTVEITNNGIREATAYDETLKPWSAVRTVKVTNRRIYLVWANRSGFVIPKRAFSSEQDWLSFINALNVARKAV